jgi:hypothetical protein
MADPKNSCQDALYLTVLILRRFDRPKDVMTESASLEKTEIAITTAYAPETGCPATQQRLPAVLMGQVESLFHAPESFLVAIRAVLAAGQP